MNTIIQVVAILVAVAALCDASSPDVPEPPERPTIVECNARKASVAWNPPGRDRGSPILNYVIQSRNSNEPGIWKSVHADSETLEQTVDLSPYANYTFRLLVRNQFGLSLPSGVSAICRTPPDAPDRNPANVMGRPGKSATSLVITWEPMPKTEHNGPGFFYVVCYCRHGAPSTDWNCLMVSNPTSSKVTFRNVAASAATFDVRVSAYNALGGTKNEAQTVRGWSG